MPEFTRSVDAKLLGRKTFDVSVEMGAPFSAGDRHYVFSRRPPPASVPAGVEFVSQSIGAFAERLRDQPGKNIWMMGGGELIASFLDEDAIDEFIITVVPIFIGAGTPLIALRHRDVPLTLRSVKPFPDGVVQVHYDLRTEPGDDCKHVHPRRCAGATSLFGLQTLRAPPLPVRSHAQRLVHR